MATSGSVNFNQTRSEIIQDSFSRIGVYGIGRTVSAEDMSLATRQLNRIIKAEQAKSLHLWAKEEAYLFISDNVGEYTLSNAAASAKMCLRSDAVITEIATAASALDTTIAVDSTTGMTAGDNIGVVGDDDTVTWTTIVSVDSATGLTITAGLGAAAAVNNNVYTFTSRVNKPLRILGMRRVTGGPSSPSSIPMMALSHEEYFNLPNKENNGNPTHYYYNPDVTEGKLYLWSRPNDPEMYFEVTFERQLEDMDADGNTLDFPSEWLDYFNVKLAMKLAPHFGKSQLLPELRQELMESQDLIDSFDNEITDIQFRPEDR